MAVYDYSFTLADLFHAFRVEIYEMAEEYHRDTEELLLQVESYRNEAMGLESRLEEKEEELADV